MMIKRKIDKANIFIWGEKLYMNFLGAMKGRCQTNNIFFIYQKLQAFGFRNIQIIEKPFKT